MNRTNYYDLLAHFKGQLDEDGAKGSAPLAITITNDNEDDVLESDTISVGSIREKACRYFNLDKDTVNVRVLYNNGENEDFRKLCHHT